jgi:VWFA-related protein
MRLLPLAVASALAVPAAPSDAPKDALREGQPPLIEVQAAEVSVDFVARDRKGRIVRDLKPNEIEVFEDGVRQDVGLFQLVTSVLPAEAPPVSMPGPGPRAAAGLPAVGPAGPEDAEREAVVALVFDRLGPEARVNAKNAADEWLKLPAVAGRQVGVFRIDRGLVQLQELTDDRAPVREALDDVERMLPTMYSGAGDRERLRGLRDRVHAIEGSGSWQSVPTALSAADDGAAVTSRTTRSRASAYDLEFERRIAAAQIAMMEALEELERDQQGLATTNALLALVNGLRTLPGRKAVVLFSEGLVLPPRVQDTLDTVISEANRGGVSFYAVDAVGLRTVSGSDEARREIAGLVEDGLRGPGRAPMSKRLERNQDVLRYDPESGLGELARDTGGFLVAGTNDIAAGLRRVEEELGAYYLLSYAPHNDDWDGRYRKIDVRVKRSGVTVQARRGYFAVRTRTPTPVLDYEAPALARLEREPGADGLPLRGRAVHFPAEDGESVVAIVASLPAGAPEMSQEKGSHELVQDFTVLALVRDAAGRVVTKASRRYSLVWPQSKAEEVKAGRVLFEREARLGPGRYTVELIALDAQTGGAGVRRFALEVPEAGAAPRVGSLVVVALAEPQALSEPGVLDYRGHLLFPNVGEPFSLASGKPIGFVLALRPGSRPLTGLTIEALAGDAALFEAPVRLPPPDESGLVRIVGEIPSAGLPPGPYTIRVVATDGTSMASRSTDLTLVP